MNTDLMTQYVKHVADTILYKLGLNAMYNEPNPVSIIHERLTNSYPELIQLDSFHSWK